MIEEYRNIPGFEGIYQVSNLGNVKALERLFWRDYKDREPHWTKHREKVLRPQKDKEGYLHVRLASEDGKYTLWKVHQLVALVFLNHDRKNREYIVHHLNHNKTDNCLDNLEIQLRSEHIRKHKLGKQ